MPIGSRLSRARLVDGILASVLGGMLAMAFVLAPSACGGVTLDGSARLEGLCWLHRLAGVDCPFCGMSRSFVALAHGQLGAALSFHPAGPLLFVAMLIAVAAILVAALRGARPLSLRPSFLQAMNFVALGSVLAGAARWLVGQ